MELLRSIKELDVFVAEIRQQKLSLGFVPTMGALHEGHLSLVAEATKTCDCCIVSIFVNPTQFNDPKDLETYPRTLEADMLLLEKAGVSAIFAPSVEEIYPDDRQETFEVGEVSRVMEGKFRPGHFEGVMQVVHRLFNLVRPDKAFFGEKDFQQIAVIRAMQRCTGSDIELVACPIIREESGLALSSRNTRLSKEDQLVAANIYRIMREAKALRMKMSVEELRSRVVEQINAFDILEVEYFEIVDSDTLLAISEWKAKQNIRACITVYCRSVRLIDNLDYSLDVE